MFDMSILYCEKDNKKSRRDDQIRLLIILRVTNLKQYFKSNVSLSKDFFYVPGFLAYAQNF